MAIQHFEDSPSPDDFSSQIESKSVPAVFKGCIKEWKAFCRWNPSNGGLDYLQKQAGSSTVEAMLSKSAPVFYGDLRNHERVPLQFSTFISLCKQLLQTTTHIHHRCVEQEGCELVKTDSKETCSTSSDARQIYLAQVPILNFENQERSPLEILQEDIQKPAFIENKALSSINLWMNSSQSRSSTHYDPHHNLLCIVAGYKKVVLWAPSASQVLYPMPIYGEASNHSAVDIGCPDFSLHSRAKNSMNYSHTVILHAGDALFIPEGWFHQVDSNDLTIAVNFWWQSNMVLNMLEHMDAYYLRRVMRRLVDKEMNQMLQEIPIDNTKAAKDVCGPTKGSGHRDIHSVGQNSNKNIEGNHQQGKMLHQLEPLALHSLHQLVSLVHDSVNVANQSQQLGSTTLEGSAVNFKGDNRLIGRTDSFLLVDDSVASILSSLEPLLLQDVLLAMVHNFPRTLEALVLHSLSPVAAEVLTRKFDEMDQQITKEEQSEFFRQFYSVFDDQFAAMDAILNGKESFACQAFRNVLDHYLAVNSGSLQ